MLEMIPALQLKSWNYPWIRLLNLNARVLVLLGAPFLLLFSAYPTQFQLNFALRCLENILMILNIDAPLLLSARTIVVLYCIVLYSVTYFNFMIAIFVTIGTKPTAAYFIRIQVRFYDTIIFIMSLWLGYSDVEYYISICLCPVMR